jgi:hypothetical protein
MNPEQLTQDELLQKEGVREQIIKSRIFFSYEELESMSQADRIAAIIQMKQDETMKWQRLASQLHYYIMIVSLILGAVIAFGIAMSRN